MMKKLLLLLLAIFCGCSSIPFLSKSPSQKFESFVDRFVQGKFPDDDESLPVPFSWLMADADSIRALRAVRGLAELRGIDTTALTVDERIDWLQLEAALKRDERDVSLRRAERTPIQYLTLGSLYWQIAGDRRATPAEWSSMLRSLHDAPEALSIGRRQLKDPPTLWTQLAVNTAKRYEEFLDGAMSGAVEKNAPDSLKTRLQAASRNASGALKSFRIFLSDTLKSDNSGSWAVGKEYYDWLLSEYHFLPYTSSLLVETGWKVHRETKAALETLARRIDSTKTWKQLVEEMKLHHPEPHRIADEYRRESNRVRDLLIAKNLIAIPPAETLIFVPTPPSLRETYAWGGYGGIEMKDQKKVGRFFVTDIVPEMTEQQVEEKLRTQNSGWLTVISLHEGYPGHHLQTVYALNNQRKIRGRLGSTYYGEGWALYCESWMARVGFYENRWDSLGWLQMRLWRTARVVIDPSIHTGRMSFDQAVQFFVDEVGLERSAAEAEVNRYTTWPTQAPSYIIGWLEIENLENEMRQKLGSRFSEKSFVEAVLSVGSLPLELMKRAVRHQFGLE